MGRTDKDINNRIGLAWAALNRLKPILTSILSKTTVKIKIRLFNAECISILLYGCETWALNASQSVKLDVLARTCYRMILGIRQSEAHVTNNELYKLVNTRPINAIIRESQLQFIGHCHG